MKWPWSKRDPKDDPAFEAAIRAEADVRVKEALKNTESFVRARIPAFEQRLRELHPKPCGLPMLGGERIVATSAEFAEIVICYLIAHDQFFITTPDELQGRVRAAVVWYYGLQAP